MDEAAARLRKTFRYPGDDNASDNYAEALDEQEQEELIETLRQEDLSRNQHIARLLLALPFLPSVLYLRSLFALPTFLPSVLALTSLACSFRTAWLLEPGKTGFPQLDAFNTPQWKLKDPRYEPPQAKGPVERFVPYLNVALNIVLAVWGWLLERKRYPAVWPGFGIVPAFAHIFIIVAKSLIMSVDVGELDGLKYGLKGA